MSVQPNYSETPFQPQRYRFTSETLQQMTEAGLFQEDDRIELIDGELLSMSPIGSEHAYLVNCLNQTFTQQKPSYCFVCVQSPILLSPYSQPQPDISIVKNARYNKQHPSSEDILLIIEVADSSYAYDKGMKIPLYAKHNVPEVWLFNLATQQVEVFSQPTLNGYRQTLRPSNDESLIPSLLPEVQINLADYW